MRCAVIAAVLLLVYIQDAAAGPQKTDISVCKSKYPAKPCGGGWYRIDSRRCAKYFMQKKTFWGAESHCRRLGSHLVSMHNTDQHNNVMCLSLRTTKSKAHFWIGGTVTYYRGDRAGIFRFKWTDGTKPGFQRWYSHQPDRASEKCVEMNYGDWGRWNNEFGGHTRFFVCAKNM